MRGKPNLIEFGGVTFVRGAHELTKTNFVKSSGQFVFTPIDQSHTHTHNPKKKPRKKPKKNLLKFF